MHTTKIIPFNDSGEFVWRDKPYDFSDLKNDLPNVALKAEEQIPDYNNASYEVNYMRKIICYVHRVVDSEVRIERFIFVNHQLGWVPNEIGN